MAKIRIGLVGCGFVSELHMYAYRRVYGVDVEVKAVAARGDHVVDFAGRHQIPKVYRSFRELMADGELDVVDICTPPNLHTSMIVKRAVLPVGSPERELEMAVATGLNCQQDRAENARPWASWRRERNWARTFST